MAYVRCSFVIFDSINTSRRLDTCDYPGRFCMAECACELSGLVLIFRMKHSSLDWLCQWAFAALRSGAFSHL